MSRLMAGERGLAPLVVIILVVLGVVVVGTVGAAAVVLANDVVITVDNRSCGTLDVAKGSAALNFNFLPGLNIPSEIPEGGKAVVQVPKRFVDGFTVSSGSVDVRAFNRSFTLGTSRINAQRSTWDGTPLSGLVGRQIDVSGDHSLVLECR